MENFSKELGNCLDEARKNGEKKAQANNYNDEMRKNVIGRELDIAYTNYVLENANKIEDILTQQIKKSKNENKKLFKEAFLTFYLQMPTGLALHQTNYNPAVRGKLTTFIDTVKVIDKINKGETYEFENTLRRYALQGLLPIKFACYLLSEEDIEIVHPYFVKYLENNGYRNNIYELNKWEKISDAELNNFIESENTFRFLDEEKARESE